MRISNHNQNQNDMDNDTDYIGPTNFEFKRIAKNKSIRKILGDTGISVNSDRSESKSTLFFDFYSFKVPYTPEYKNANMTRLSLSEPLMTEEIYPLIMEFFNGMILLYLSKLKGLVTNPLSPTENQFMNLNHESCVKTSILTKSQLKTTLSHFMKLINDNFTLDLINHDLYEDLEEYFVEFLFKSPIYRVKIITLVRDIIQKRWQ